MAVPFLDAMANAIYYYEGHQPEDRNHRNNNPGNLRAWKRDQEKDADDYRIFPTFIEGYAALWNDIRAKVTGNNSHGLSLDSSLLDFFNVYAPSQDSNAPELYAQFVAHWLGKTYGEVIDPYATFRAILEAIGQKVE